MTPDQERAAAIVREFSTEADGSINLTDLALFSAIFTRFFLTSSSSFDVRAFREACRRDVASPSQ